MIILVTVSCGFWTTPESLPVDSGNSCRLRVDTSGEFRMADIDGGISFEESKWHDIVLPWVSVRQ
jgi:hypothetical protein